MRVLILGGTRFIGWHIASTLKNAFPYRKSGADPDAWRYDYDKIPIERLLLEEPAFRATVLRLPAVYGPRDYQGRVWEYLRWMDAGRKAIVVSESLSNWRWSRGYVENIAAAVSHLLTHQPAAVGVFNLSDPVVLSQREWIERIADPFTLKESLRKTVEWHRANPPQLSAAEQEQYRREDDAEDQVLSRA
jgi:nucleoside-diphosphate-sugar epimerase